MKRGLIIDNIEQSPSQFLLCCTKKLQKELGVSKADGSNEGVSVERQWHANIFRAQRRKCLIFTHSITLYTFVVLRVLKRDLVNIEQVFLENLELQLIQDGLEDPLILPPSDQIQHIPIKKSQNMSVVASMNDFIWRIKAHIEDSKGIQFADNYRLSSSINEMPVGAVNYWFPRDKLSEIIEENRRNNAG